MRRGDGGLVLAALLFGCAGRAERGTPRDLPVPHGPPPAAVTAMLAEISPPRLRATVDRLASFGTRHTLSDPDSPVRGIGAARRFLAAELGQVAPLRVELESHRLAPDGRRVPRAVELVNVVAVLPGGLPEAAGRRYYVVGHYDSRASNPLDAESDAPGANDDGSGTAVVLELARVMARHRFDATLVFLATAGEEQGLLGARAHLEKVGAGKADIRAVLNNDIVGDPSPSPPADRARVRVFAEGGPDGDSPARELGRRMVEVAAWHGLAVRPWLIGRRDRFLRGGDQLPFLEAGVPAVRLTVVDESYDRQHQNVRTEGSRAYGDLPAFVDAGYLAGVARLDAATLAHLANAPSPPRDPRLVMALEPGTRLRWGSSPEPDVAGYEVLWRDTTSVFWQGVRDVGSALEASLPQSKDNFLFGVRAYDREGYRSPAASPRPE